MDRTVAHLFSRLRMVFIYLVVLYVLGGLILYFFQDRIIFLAEKLEPGYHFEFDTPFEEHFVSTPLDGKINALVFKADSSKGLVIYYHGNAGSLARWGLVAEEFVPLGYDVAMIDYRGYGKSSGKRTQEALLSDALAVHDYFQKEYGEEVVLYGRSIGSGMASYVASKRDARLLILETPFYDLESLAQSVIPIFPVSWALKYNFSNYENLKEVTCPVYLFHGTNDSVIPYDHAQRLFNAHPAENMTLFTIEGGDHNDLGAYPAFWRSMREVLR